MRRSRIARFLQHSLLLVLAIRFADGLAHLQLEHLLFAQARADDVAGFSENAQQETDLFIDGLGRCFLIQTVVLVLDENFLAVGRSKTEGGEGRTIPLNSALLPELLEYAEWYKQRFGETRPEWYVFPWGKPRPSDPTRPVTTLKTAWNNIRENAEVTGRWHDNRHTLITELAESGAGDQTIMDIAGHVSKQMLSHYSHIRMEAKRTALESFVRKPTETNGADQEPGQVAESLQGLQNGSRRHGGSQGTTRTGKVAAAKNGESQCSDLPANTRVFEGESLQKSLQSCNFEGHRGWEGA